MTGILLAVVALGLYWLSIALSLSYAIVIGLVALLVVAPLPYMGRFIGHENPSLARWLLWTWTPAVLVVGGALSAVLIYLGLIWVAKKNADISTQVLFGAIGAVVTAIAGGVNDWVESILAWRSRSLLCDRYRPMFPCSPVNLGPGREAYEALSEGCLSDDDSGWSGTFVESTLSTIGAAIAAGQFQGGDDWECP